VDDEAKRLDEPVAVPEAGPARPVPLRSKAARASALRRAAAVRAVEGEAAPAMAPVPVPVPDAEAPVGAEPAPHRRLNLAMPPAPGAAPRLGPAAVPEAAPPDVAPAPPTAAPAADPAGPPPPAAQRPRVVVRPVAQPARIKRRHRGLIASFVLLVLIPFAVTVAYLWGVARDQYASTVGFTVRQEDGASAVDILGGLGLGGSRGGASDADILYEFIQSQVMVQTILAAVDLRDVYARHWPRDPVFALWPDAGIEDLVWFWKRMVRISYDRGSGLVQLRVLAPTPEEAQAIAKAIVGTSQAMINDLNAAARDDTMSYALADRDAAVERLKQARQNLSEFRTRTRIVDPEADIQGRMGVLNSLQQQLAQAMVDYDLLAEQAAPGDPRLRPAQQKIDVIRGRIEKERTSFTLGDDLAGGDYPALIAEFESLNVERGFAERTYTSALTALDAARSNADRRTRYLAEYIQPTLAQTSEFPQRFTLAGLTGLFLLLGWAILALVYYSLRDRR